MNRKEFEKKFVFYELRTQRKLIRANSENLNAIWQWIEQQTKDLLKEQRTEGNGDNEFSIVIKCPYEVYKEEWFEILVLVNTLLAKHEDGKYNNVGAFLVDEPVK